MTKITNNNYWDDVFLNSPQSKPIEELNLILSYLKSGKILDLGCGDGKNSLYLAQKNPNYEITSVDFSKVACQKLNDKAFEYLVNGRIKTINADLNNYSIKENYDCIISTFTFHLLNKKTVSRIISEIQTQTNRGGFNFIIAFTNLQNIPNDYISTFEINELKNLYSKSNWQIVEYRIFDSYIKRDINKEKPLKAILLFARKI